MQNFYINIDGITKSTNELLDVSNGINTVALKVSDIAQDLKKIGLGQLSGAMASIENRLITNKIKTEDLSVVLNTIKKEYMIAEKNIQFSGYAVRISAKSSGLQILQDVSEKNKFFDNIQNQYGFDDDKRDSWRNNMQTGLGLNDLSDEDLQNQINQLYYMYNDKGDFSHMCYTLSGCINNDWGGVDNRWRKGHTEGWGSLNTRKDVIGWLGDATITTDASGPSFGPDDYIADLDADNIYNRIDYDNGVTAMDAFNDYYEDMANSGDSDFRGKEFLQNNSYETVEEAILDKLDISLEDLKSNKDYSDTVEFLERLKDLCEESR